MPDPSQILAVLGATVRASLPIAIAWHAALAAVVLAALRGWRPTRRAAGLFVAAVLGSVAVLAARHGGAFNAVLVGAGAVTIASGALHADGRVELAHRASATAGAAVLAYAWVYPHFLDGLGPVTRLVASPVGVVPCPSIAAGIGLALLGRGVVGRGGTAVLVALGLFYALFGVLRLGVTLDVGLLCAAVALLTEALRPPAGVTAPPASAGAPG